MRKLLTRLFSKGLPARFLIDNYPYTPDVVHLQTRPRWRILVVDEMMRPHFNHKLLGDKKEWRQSGVTLHDMSLWMRENGKLSTAVPMMVKYANIDFCPIRGEIWSVPTDVIIKLDTIKKNTVEFSRIKLPIALPHSHNGQHELNTDYEAFVYVGRPEHWNPIFVRGTKSTYDNGTRIIQSRIHDTGVYKNVRTYSPKNKLLGDKFYYYAPVEYQDSK